MLLIRNTEVSTKPFSKFFHRGTSPEIISAACPFCLSRRRRARGQRVSRKADNAAYASVRMLAVSNAQILRVGGARGLIFLMWQGCEHINIKGSTDKFGTTILTHLFRPHFGGKSSTEPHSASGFPPCSEKNLRQSGRPHFISAS